MDSDFGFSLHMGVDALLVAVVFLAWVAPHIERAFGRGGGRWRDLAKKYPTSGPAPQGALPRQNVMIGPVLYRNCMTVGADESGLYLAPARPLSFALKQNLRIPWRDIVKTEKAKLLWGEAITLIVGAPALATLTLKAEVLEKLVRPRLFHVSWKHEKALDSCFDAFSSREPASTSLENALAVQARQ